MADYREIFERHGRELGEVKIKQKEEEYAANERAREARKIQDEEIERKRTEQQSKVKLLEVVKSELLLPAAQGLADYLNTNIRDENRQWRVMPIAGKTSFEHFVRKPYDGDGGYNTNTTIQYSGVSLYNSMLQRSTGPQTMLEKRKLFGLIDITMRVPADSYCLETLFMGVISKSTQANSEMNTLLDLIYNESYISQGSPNFNPLFEGLYTQKYFDKPRSKREQLRILDSGESADNLLDHTSPAFQKASLALGEGLGDFAVKNIPGFPTR